MQSLAVQLLSMLDNGILPLSSRDLASQLDREIFRAADYEVTRALRSLLRQGLVTLKDGRWTSVRAQSALPVRPEFLRFPNISLESARLLGGGWQRGVSTSVGIGSSWIDDFAPEKAPDDDLGRWGKFRRLLEYYRQCVRTECGAEASSYLDQAGASSFICVNLGLGILVATINGISVYLLGRIWSSLSNSCQIRMMIRRSWWAILCKLFAYEKSLNLTS